MSCVAYGRGVYLYTQLLESDTRCGADLLWIEVPPVQTNPIWNPFSNRGAPKSNPRWRASRTPSTPFVQSYPRSRGPLAPDQHPRLSPDQHPMGHHLPPHPHSSMLRLSSILHQISKTQTIWDSYLNLFSLNLMALTLNFGKSSVSPISTCIYGVDPIVLVEVATMNIEFHWVCCTMVTFRFSRASPMCPGLNLASCL